MSVLVVDGVTARREFLVRTLPELGYQAHAVHDGAAALARLTVARPALVLLDVGLPNGGTEAVLLRRAADAALRDIPVLLVGTPGDVDRVAHGLSLGADDYLSEPFFAPLLRARVAGCLERRRLQRDGQRSDRDLDIGRDIQRGFLPAAMPVWPGWELDAVFEAARQVSGDFYDAFYLADGLMLGVVVGDVCGKGVGASLFMALFRSLIRALATQVVRSGRTVVGALDDDRLFTALGVANDYIATVHGDANMFATAFAASIDPRSGIVRWANAGHEPALIVGVDGGVRARLTPSGAALGLFPELTLTVGTARLAPGESLLLTTDGASEARSPSGALFGDDRIESLCVAPVPSAHALTTRVADAVHAFGAGEEPADDLTLLAVRRC